jgi:Tol biopolymer transport system component
MKGNAMNGMRINLLLTGLILPFAVMTGCDMDMDGRNLVNLTNDPGSDVEPAFSPDGSKIAFRSDRDVDLNIYLMNVDGTGVTNLTQNASIDSQPAFSPDGRKIAFTSNRNGNREIYVMNADGSEPTRITLNVASDDSPTVTQFPN